MTVYMDPRESARYAFGDDDRRIVELIAGRYVGANPPVPFALRAFAKTGVLQNAEGLYDMELGGKLPQSKPGDFAYVFGLVWSDDERPIDGVLEPLGPVRFYMNEQLLYRSSAVDEMKPDARAVIPLPLRKGWNTLLIQARRTPAGFGCRFGAVEAKVRILNVLAPFAERSGSAGWVYAGPVPAPLFGENGAFPDWRLPESSSGLSWLPETRWTKAQAALPNAERLFGWPASPAAAYGWTRLSALPGADIELTGRAFGPTSVWLDGRLVASLTEDGAFRATVRPTAASPQLLVRTVGGERGWGFELEAHSGGQRLAFEPPVHAHGCKSPWLYAGPVDPKFDMAPGTVTAIGALLPAVDEAGEPAGFVTWSADAPMTRVRPYYENAMLSNKWTSGAATNFGRWDYPLGVTMYGLLRASRALGRDELARYALDHIRCCTGLYEYSLWDRDEYGFPSINHQLVLMRMLDNCGSFGSAMLEAQPLTGDAGLSRIADTIADFVLCRLERREDGAFYRQCAGEYSADTMWADDLYMSVPFLVRYAAAAGKPEAMDEAVRQFLLYRRYLFMEDERLMSHVFDFKYGQATRVPWGRGNGWVLFSLSELLERLPADHPGREELLSFFRDLCAGVAALQTESGLWRQVLNEPEAYEESSCTAMFAYAFARGVRFGWLADESRYADAAIRAWRGLTERAIDRAGNVYGVCSGSRYSFSPEYYMYDLGTVVNDNHGIGIMMLAGVEIGLLKAAAAGWAADSTQ